MRVPAAVSALLIGAVSLVAAEPVRPPLVHYVIEARYDHVDHTIRGEETVVWRNHSDGPVTSIPLHLYLNAFRDGSTFLEESDDTISTEDQGGMELRSLRVNGREALASLQFIAPDDGNADDRTLAEIPLSTPLAAGASIRLEMQFEARLPRVYARTGWSDEFVFAGQWYPKPAVLEPTGTRGRSAPAFNRHQFHADSEFYAEFADFDVTLDTPADWVLGATGIRRADSVASGRRTTRWIARNVHDFAWSASPHFIERIYRFDPARSVPNDWRNEASRLLNIPTGELTLRPVEVRLLMQPDNERLTERYRDAVFASLAWGGLRLGAYPWPQLTVVDPPSHALDAGGMEYPMLITAMTSPIQAMWPFSSISRYPEVVLVHEVGHQWFYAMIGSNEFEEPWLDEGLTSWFETEVIDAMYPDGAVDLGVLPPLSLLAFNRLGFLQSDEENIDPLVRNSWGYAPSGYVYNAYQRSQLAVFQIEGMIGEGPFARGMRRYAQHYAFRHPGTSEFLGTMESVSGADLSAIRRGVFGGTERFDHRIAAADTWSDGELWHTELGIVREGGLSMGATARLYYADGTMRDLEVPPHALLIRWSVMSRTPVRKIVIDPARDNILESDASNNVHVFEDRRTWRVGAALRAVALVSHAVRVMVAGW